MEGLLEIMRMCVYVFEWKIEFMSAFVMKKKEKGILLKWPK